MRALILRRHAACALAAACVLPPPRSGAADYATTEEAAARQVEAELQQTARFFREPPIFPLLSAQRSLEALLADEATFRELARLGLPTGAQQVPVVLLPEYLERLGDVASDRAAWAAAAREYVRDARDADELMLRHRRRAWPAARPRRGVRRPRSGCVEARRGRAADARAAAAEGPAEPREASAEGGRRDGEAFRRWPVYSCPVRLAHGTGQGQPLRADIRWTSSRTVDPQ